ncbi:MAG: hypothetical protein ACKVOU_04915, partial [Cytophagales bacterium]
MFKKLQICFTFFILFFLGIQASNAQSITIASPTPNSTITGCAPFSVSFTSTGVSGFRYEYSIDGVRWKQVGNYIGSSPFTTAEIPSLAGNPEITIRITDYYNSDIGSTITGIRAAGNLGQNNLEFTNPAQYGYNNAISYNFGSSVELSWNANFYRCIPFATILLSTNAGVDFPITVASFTNLSSGNFYYNHNTIANGAEKAVFKIMDSYNTSNFALSPFVNLKPGVVNSTPIQITSPSPLATLVGCTQNTINYTGTINSYVDFQYSLDGGSNWVNGATFIWGGFTSTFSFVPPAITGVIQTRFVKNNAPFQTITGANYNVANSIPQIRFTNPSINSKIDRTNVLTLTWNALPSCLSLVKIENSVNNGVSWNTLYLGTNTSNFSMVTSVLSTLPNASLLRISDANNADNYNITQLVLDDPLIVVSTVAGSINFSCPNANSSFSFNKFGLGQIYNFNLQYSLNGGASWQTINANYQSYNNNPVVYNWNNMPEAVYTSTGVLVKVTEISSGLSVSGSALVNFAAKIPDPTLGIISPASLQPVCGAYFKPTFNFCSNLDVFLTTNAGADLIPVTVNANFQQFYSDFPLSYANGVDFRVVYRQSSNPTVSVLGNNFQFAKGFSSVSMFGSNQLVNTLNYVVVQFPQLCNILNVNIDFSTDGGTNYTNFASNVANNANGTYSYTTPSSTTTGFRVKISSSIDPTVSVTSNVASLVNPTGAVVKSLTITSISLSTICGSSSTIAISRNYTNGLYYSLSYSLDAGSTWKLATEYFIYSSNLNGSSSYSFPFVSSNQFQLKISERDNPSVFAVSNVMNLNISLTGSLLTMAAPNTLVGGTFTNVNYSSNTNCVPYLNVFLSTNNGVSFQKVYEKISTNVGYFGWTALDMDVAQARYKLESWSNPAISVTSAAFSITKSMPVVTGVTFTGVPSAVSSCANYAVNFQHIPFTTQSFKLEMTTDEGSSWKLLTNTNIYGNPTFNISNISVGELPINTIYKLRISRSDNPSISATTTGITVTALGVPGLQISAPNSASVYGSNSSASIVVNTTGAGCSIKEVKLEYSIDNGINFRIINDKIAVANNYFWYIPKGTNSNNVLLRISDSKPNSVTVTSQSFAISDPNILVSVDGVVFQGSNTIVKVASVGITNGDNYYGFYSVNGGTSWIATGYVGYFQGSSVYNINFTPPSVTSLTSALFQVANNNVLANSTIKYFSNPFQISRPDLQFTSPLEGARFLATNSGSQFFNYSFAGWSFTPMYLYATYDNGISAESYINSSNISGSNNRSISWTLPLVGSVTGVKLAFGNGTTWASSTSRYFSEEFFLTPPLLSITSPLVGQNIEANGLLQTNIVYTFSGWPTIQMYPYYSFDNGITAIRMSPFQSPFLSGTNTNNFNWTPPLVSTITATRLCWANSSVWTSATAKFLDKTINLVPAINNVVTVTATNATFGMCQGRQVVLTFGGSGVYSAGNKYVAEIVSSEFQAVGSGYQAGEISSTLTSGVITITTPTVGYVGSWRLRVYSTAPQITNINNLKFVPINLGANTCITANNNDALLTIDGIGSIALNGNIAYQINTTFGGGNQFIAQLSNSVGGFNAPLNIGSVASTSAGTIPVEIPVGIPTGSAYQIRVVSTNLPVISSPTVSFTLNNAFIDVRSVAGDGFCPGKPFSTVFDADGNFLSGNQFRVELSNSAGNFPTGTFIGSLSDDLGGIDLVANSTIPSSIANSASYRVRVQSTNPFSNTSYNAESPNFVVFSNCFSSVNNNAGPYFSGSPLVVRISPNTTFGGGNVYIAQLSDQNGSFVNPQFIGSVLGSHLATISGFIPNLSSSGSNFTYRVISTNHAATSNSIFLGNISPISITLSPSINASGFCQEAYVKLGNLTILGVPSANNQYIVQMNDNGSSNFFSPYNVFSFNSSATGIVSVPGFYIPTSVPGNGDNRSFRVVSSNPSAISQNILSGFSYNTKCFGSITLNTGIYVPNQNYSTTYNLYPGVAYAAGNQMIAEISSNNFVTAVGIGFVTSVSSGTIPTAIPSNLPTGNYQVRVRATDFASTSFPENIYLNQVNIAPGAFDNSKQYCQGGKISFNNFTVSSPVNIDNKYIVQVSTNSAFPNNSTFGLATITSSNIGEISVPEIDIPTLENGDGNYYYRITSTSPAGAVNSSGGTIYFRKNCLTQSNVASTYCPNEGGIINYNSASFKSGNSITALLSDGLGNFNTPLPIGSKIDFAFGNGKSLNFTIPSGLQEGNNYRIKLISSDFATESVATSPLEIKQVCISQPAGFNPFVSQCSFIPLVTVSAFGSVNPDNAYKLILTYTNGAPVSGGSLNSVLGIVMSNAIGTISFENVIIPTVSGTYRLRVEASSPNVAGTLTNTFNITNNCIGAPYFPASKICAGSPYQANVYIGSGNTYNVGNQFIVELSNGSGSFASPTVVASQTTTFNNFVLVVTIPSGLATGSNYQLRTRSTNPVFTSNAGNIFTIDQICLSAGAVAFGPYIGGSSSISIPVVNVGTVAGGNTFAARMYGQYGNLIGTIGSSSTNTISGTVPTVSNGGYYYTIITSSNPVATSSVSNLFIVNPTDIKVASISGSYCVGSTVSGINFTVAGSVGGGNLYFVDLSDASGNFYYSYDNLNSISDNTVGNKMISAVLPIGITQSPNYRLRVRSSNGSISNETPININATFEWTGSANKDWNNAANWSCPLIPTSNIDVVIPIIGNSNYPEINVTNAVARNLTVNTLASAFVLDDGLLSVYGNLIVNGTFNSNTLGGIVFQGGYATTHDILGTGIVNLGLVTVPGFNYLNIRNS